ncbi:hypothetical protein [Boseongicola aestuarii]|jgi:hypothetical protein|uniref:Uncharacterized protein n=1 Tax=Boseongicola aestuarii TaxID=1470561 RepID=A0A238IWK2_9RHOB|nr:hypothetical protein [Boseongicola aestuarii]SMX22064.1 hypothetical protein BOA8489_00153 [Boseongicola aestuarii]
MTFSKSTALIASLLALAACGGGDSGSGLFGWLTQEEPVEMLNEVEFAVVRDQRPLVASVESLVIERLPGGIIVRATGLPPMQGWYDAQLVREANAAAGPGVLVYSFRARPPETPTRVSTQQSRELIVGTYLSDLELAGITSIRVLAAGNARTVGR